MNPGPHVFTRRRVLEATIVGPAFPRFGVVLAEAGACEEMIVSTINLRQQARFEKIFDYRCEAIEREFGLR